MDTNLSFSTEESNKLVGWILDNFSEKEILNLFHDLDKYVHFYANDKQLLENDASLYSLIDETPRKIILSKLKQIRKVKQTKSEIPIKE